MVHWRDVHSSSPVRTSKLQLAAKQLLTGECWIPPKKKDTRPIQGQRRSPRKIVGGSESCLQSNPTPARDTQKAQINLVCTRTQRLQRRSQSCV